MEKNENVSIISGSHNRDYDEITYGEAILDGDRIVGVRGISNQTWFASKPDGFWDEFTDQFRPVYGCKWIDFLGFTHILYCVDCRAGQCPEFYVCNFDDPRFRDYALEPVFQPLEF